MRDSIQLISIACVLALALAHPAVADTPEQQLAHEADYIVDCSYTDQAPHHAGIPRTAPPTASFRLPPPEEGGSQTVPRPDFGEEEPRTKTNGFTPQARPGGV